MAGFPGRWLGSLCFLISFTPSTFLRQAGPGERDACCRGTPPPTPPPAPGPEEEGRGLRLWMGQRHAWHCCRKSVARLLLGDVLFHFPSFRLLQAGMTSGSLARPFSDSPSSSSYTALGQPSRCSVQAAVSRGDSCGLSSLSCGP